jgi:hypothetical protein
MELTLSTAVEVAASDELMSGSESLLAHTTTLRRSTRRHRRDAADAESADRTPSIEMRPRLGEENYFIAASGRIRRSTDFEFVIGLFPG